MTKRTIEIEQKNQELESTLNSLKETQGKLVETEKMAALGELVAGIAHEINTPVGIGVTAASHLDKITRDFVNITTKEITASSKERRILDNMKKASNMVLSNLIRASELIASFKRVAVDQITEEQRLFSVRQYLDSILLSLGPKLKNRNIGILITDHNVRETLKIVDRVYIVNEGSIFFEGKPEDAIKNKMIKKFYLGTNFSI